MQVDLAELLLLRCALKCYVNHLDYATPSAGTVPDEIHERLVRERCDTRELADRIEFNIEAHKEEPAHATQTS